MVLIIIVAAAVIFSVYMLIKGVRSDFANGGEVVSVPDVTGMIELEAEAAVKDQGLIPTIVRNHSDLQPAGYIFEQDPAPRSKTKQGHKIKLYSSLGKMSFTVPDLINSNIGAVPDKLRDSGLILGAITKIFRADLADGLVVNQNPRPGMELASSAQVDIVVVDNANLTQIEMPEITGMQLFSVEELLARSNLVLARVDYAADDTVNGSTVIRQNIEPGEMVTIGTPVEVTVALPGDVMERPVKTVTINIPVPDGPQDQPVKIKVFDALGGNVLYDEVRSPGERVEQRLDIEGDATIFIFINDMNKPYREEHI